MKLACRHDMTWPSHYSPRCANLAEKRNAGTRVCCVAYFRSDMVFRLQSTEQRTAAKHTNKNMHWTATQVTAHNSTYLHCHANMSVQNVYMNTRRHVSWRNQAERDMRVCHAGQQATTVSCNVKPYLTTGSHDVENFKHDRWAAVKFSTEYTASHHRQYR